MFDVTLLLLIMPLAAGLVLGYFLRGRRRLEFEKATVGVIVVLVFSLGFSIGSNNVLLESLPRVGLASFVVASLSIVFSVFFVMLVRKRIGLK
jgi:4-hydroxybenzoate polyprenyltransferase